MDCSWLSTHPVSSCPPFPPRLKGHPTYLWVFRLWDTPGISNSLCGRNIYTVNCHKMNISNSILKLIKYACRQKPINDSHLGQVDESWYLVKHQIKHHQVFIWDETCCSSMIKHLHFDEIFHYHNSRKQLMQYMRKNVTE